MEIVLGIIAALFTITGIVILVRANNNKEKIKTEKKEPVIPPSDCCGGHEICEFDQIKMDETIIEYYDDEELDVFKNRADKDYSNNDIDLFRDVLYTLKTNEISHWLLSIERREIKLPSILLSEARMLMAEG